MSEPSKQKLEQIRNNFAEFDRDDNGQIDFMEFKELMKAIAPDAKLGQVGEGFSIIDTDSDGYINFDEFVEWWQTGWDQF